MTPVVRIVVQGEDSQRNWIIVARLVHKHLVDHGITDTGFEVYAKALEEGLSVFSVFKSDDIYVLWEEVVEEIQKELGLKGIATIGCLRIGADDTANECPPTIQLGVEPTVQRDWKTFRDQILAILDRHNLSMVGVFIRKDRLWGSMSIIYNHPGESDEDLNHVVHVADRDNSELAARWAYQPRLIPLDEENPGEAEFGN